MRGEMDFIVMEENSKNKSNNTKYDIIIYVYLGDS